MPKYLVVTLCAFVLWPSLALADVSGYGVAHLSVNLDSVGAETANGTDSATTMASNESRIGFKGKSLLEHGIELSFQVERQLDWDNNSEGSFTAARNTFVGLIGDFGEVRFGRHDMPYKLAKTDIFVGSRADFNSIMGSKVSGEGLGHNLRLDNTILYLSPNLNNFSLSLAHSLDASDDTLASDPEQDALSLAVNYSIADLKMIAAYESIQNAVHSTSGKYDDEAIKFIVNYSLLEHTSLGLIFETLDAGKNDAGNDLTQDNLYFSIVHALHENIKVKFSYIQASDYGNVTNSGANQYALGLTKTMAKTTEFYVLYAKLTAEENSADYSLFGGQKLKATGSPGKEKTAETISLGLIHKFSFM